MDSDDRIKPRARAEQTQLLTWREPPATEEEEFGNGRTI
jgi:hypothetical protein